MSQSGERRERVGEGRLTLTLRSLTESPFCMSMYLRSFLEAIEDFCFTRADCLGPWP